ncbi:MAG: metallophosphoesterase family protein [Clostridiaceae bacterium]
MKRLKKPVSLILAIFLLLTTFAIKPKFTVQAETDSNVLLSRDAEWNYSDNGVDQGTAWRAENFDDSNWKKGKAPLGYGDDVSETDPNIPIGTKVEYGDAANKYMTTYFRTKVNAADLSKYSALEVYLHVDDGAVVYINGVEAFRKGIPDGDVTYSTAGKFKAKEETFTIPVTALKAGENTIAAEVHQDGPDSSDLWFEMSVKGLTGTEPNEPENPEVVIPDPNAPIGSVSKVTVTFYGDTTTSKGFTWYTTLASANSDLQIVEKTGSAPDFSKGKAFTGRYSISTNSASELVHKAEAAGLKPSTTYFFRVGDSKLGIWSNVGTFKTASQNGAFTFIDIADTQAKTEEEAILSGQTITKALQTVKNAAFIAHNGDIVDTGMNEKQWNWLIGHSQESFLNTTIAPAAGNHDEDKNSFIDHFNLKVPEGSSTLTGAYYSYDYSNAHFVFLNNNEDSPEYADFTPAQIEWLKADVKAAKAAGSKWIIVTMHKGPYTTSNHATDSDIMGSNGVRTKVAPLMAELGIDLVLQGHDHIYARTKPIKADGTAAQTTKITETVNGTSFEYAVNPDGTTYLIPGTGGPKVYYKNKEINSSYYDLFEVADENHGSIYGADPSDPSRPVRSQIQNFESISIDGNKLSVISYEIDQNKNSGKPYIIDTFGFTKADTSASSTPVLPKTGSMVDLYGLMIISGILIMAGIVLFYTSSRKNKQER